MAKKKRQRSGKRITKKKKKKHIRYGILFNILRKVKLKSSCHIITMQTNQLVKKKKN